MIKWNVYLRGKHVDTIQDVPGLTSQQIKRWLMEHEGYAENVELRKVKK